MKKVFLTMFCVIIVLLMMNMKVKSDARLSVSAQCAVLLDSQSGRVLYEKNSGEQRPIASISKIMTALVAIENSNLDEYVTISKKATLQIGSSLYLEEGTQIKLRDLLYGLMLRSGNDAAYAIAEHVAGNVNTFVLMMNEKAKSLGLRDSTFENPSGLDENNRNISTAYDMAIISKNAMENVLFREINNTSIHRAETKDGKFFVWSNKHKLIKGYDFIIGGKTGYTKLAKRTLVSVANKNNFELISVTLNGPDDWNDHMKLFDYGFKEYDLKIVLEKGIFEVKKLNDIFYIDDQVVYPMRNEEMNDFKIVIDVDSLSNQPYLLLVKDNQVMLRKEIIRYDSTHSVLKDSITIIDIWNGMKEFIREMLW
ncbi:D-alanyl-D-alanine carboxypeptidase [Mycoplasmatota bacterium]|nr:D-alanyl-D-alanine carboxypeptidase [Mycoplasmatota bacterium]